MRGNDVEKHESLKGQRKATKTFLQPVSKETFERRIYWYEEEPSNVLNNLPLLVK